MPSHRWLLPLPVIAACLFQASVSSAAEITAQRLDGGEVVITVIGSIAEGDDAKFRQLALQYPKAVVAFDSPGGRLAPALEIGKAIRLNGYPTVVTRDAQCASSCALIWLAGTPRYLSPGGRVGFHASYVNVGGQSQETGVGNALVGHYLSLLNLSEAAVIFATMASPRDVTWLSPANRASSGIDYQDFNDGPTSARTEPASPDRKAEAGEYASDRSNGRWHVVGASNTLVLFADPATRVLAGDLTRIWVKSSLVNDEQGWSRTMSQYEVRCRTNSYRLVQSIVYKTDGSNFSLGATEWLIGAPETVAESAINYICERAAGGDTTNDTERYTNDYFANRK